MVSAAMARKQAAEEKAVAKEQATANVLGKIRGQEEADRATLEVRLSPPPTWSGENPACSVPAL